MSSDLGRDFPSELADRCSFSQNDIVEIDKQKLLKIKMLALDVDGILTDCRIWYDGQGQWRRFFSIRDGAGIKRLIDHGYQLAIITGSQSEDIRERAKSLKIHYFFEGALDKVPSFQKLIEQSKLKPEEIAYMGDDYFDIPLLKDVGFSATAPEAMPEVIDVVDYVCQRPGGNGAVREVCDLIFQFGALTGEQQ